MENITKMDRMGKANKVGTCPDVLSAHSPDVEEEAPKSKTRRKFLNKFKSGPTSNRVVNTYKNGITKAYGSPSKYNEKFQGQNKLQLYMQDHTARVRESSRRKQK